MSAESKIAGDRISAAQLADALHKICDDWEDSDYLDISRVDAQAVVHAARSSVAYKTQRDVARGEAEAATREVDDLGQALGALLVAIGFTTNVPMTTPQLLCAAEDAAKDAANNVPDICPIIMANDDSIGGEGIVRCNCYGTFSEDRTTWTCSEGHVIIDAPNPYCVVLQCPCRALVGSENQSDVARSEQIESNSTNEADE